jgi:hypothetical protein
MPEEAEADTPPKTATDDNIAITRARQIILLSFNIFLPP